MDQASPGVTPLCGRALDHRREAADDQPARRPGTPTLGAVLAARLGRRQMLQGSLAVTAMAALGLEPAPAAARAASPDQPAPASEGRLRGFDFQGLAHGVDATHHVADGHQSQILLRWGDPLFVDAPAFDPARQTPQAQSRQFGYNNDFIGLVPVPGHLDDSDRALLLVNHEYTNEALMFPAQAEAGYASLAEPALRAAVEMAAHGGTVVEIERSRPGAPWTVRQDSPFNRRITATTPMRLSGPAAGHPRLITKADPTGTRVLGTLNNCAGGVTPWGTWLMAEENFHGYFQGDPTGHPEAALLERYGIPGGWYGWAVVDPRFDLAQEPNEPHRFGWVVEVDPADPTAMPVKRTALGRFKHEGAETIVNRDGRVVVFMGDDQRFDYVYRFVTTRAMAADAVANRDLLDDGTLSVARFDADGTVTWLPLIQGEGPLTAANGFATQADVLIGTRAAADLVGATPMDRPEDVEADPLSGRLWVVLTNNARRTADQVDAANPRADNRFGHILEVTAADGDFAATTMHWGVLVRCGDPAVAAVGARWNPLAGDSGWFASPDNCAVDPSGRLWIATDQGDDWPQTGTADGLWALETDGPERGRTAMLFRVPVGAELCGPRFTRDGRSLFLAVQHPAADGAEAWAPHGRPSTYADPATRWPDFAAGMPPRPSVVVVTRSDGGRIA